MVVRIEKIVCTILHEAHKRQVEETIDTLSEGPERFDVPTTFHSEVGVCLTNVVVRWGLEITATLE